MRLKNRIAIGEASIQAEAQIISDSETKAMGIFGKGEEENYINRRKAFLLVQII